MKKSKPIENEYFCIERFNYAEKKGEYAVNRHYHNFYEIYYMENGCCSYFIDSKSFQPNPGDLLLIPEGVIHSTLYTQNKPSRILVNCSRKYIPLPALALFSKNNYLYRNSDIKDYVAELLFKIKDEYTNPDEFSDDVIQSHMRVLLFTLARNKNQYKISDSKSTYIEEAVNYIQKNLAYDLSLSEIASRLSVSSEHFSRMFKRETGFGFNEYLNLLRLKKAEELLKNEPISVSEIAMMCGFNDCNYFSTKFKKMYGISPKALQVMSRGYN